VAGASENSVDTRRPHASFTLSTCTCSASRFTPHRVRVIYLHKLLTAKKKAFSPIPDLPCCNRSGGAARSRSERSRRRGRRRRTRRDLHLLRRAKAVCRHRPRQRDGLARSRWLVDMCLNSDEANRATTTAKLLDMEFLSISPDGDVLRPPRPSIRSERTRRATSLLRRRALAAATRDPGAGRRPAIFRPLSLTGPWC
jgi:hypothetical protein